MDEEDWSFADYTPPAFVKPPKEFELPYTELKCGKIRPGDTVELADHSQRNPEHLISGDFLLVRSIIENVKTEEVKLRGYRMRRCAYLQPMFERKCYLSYHMSKYFADTKQGSSTTSLCSSKYVSTTSVLGSHKVWSTLLLTRSCGVEAASSLLYPTIL